VMEKFDDMYSRPRHFEIMHECDGDASYVQTNYGSITALA